jgi:GMP synthase (glutamine-hydrolysing)
LKADSKITVPVCHQDQITRIPDGSIRIASNEHCQNFIVFFGNHTLGIQGHPEFEDRYLNALIEYKKNELTDEEYLIAKQSRPHLEDSKILRNVILDFFFRVTKSEQKSNSKGT